MYWIGAVLGTNFCLKKFGKTPFGKAFSYINTQKGAFTMKNTRKFIGIAVIAAIAFSFAALQWRR